MADYTPSPYPPPPWRADTWARMVADAETANAGREPVSPEEFILSIRTDLTNRKIPTHPDIMYYAAITPASQMETKARNLAIYCTPPPGYQLALDQSGNVVKRFGGPARDALHPDEESPIVRAPRYDRATRDPNL